MMNLKSKRTKAGLILGSFALGGAALVGVPVLSGTANAWPTPSTNIIGGACDANGHRSPVVATVTNLETGMPRSPATISHVVVNPVFPFTTFAPQPLPNTGTSQASTTIDVPESFHGTITLTYQMDWSGPDGSDSRDGSGTINVYKCTQPTTTTTQEQTTTTTQPVTTTTQEQTTTTTQPVTTTTQEQTTTTTQPETTTSTVPESTTSTVPESTTSTVPETSTTVPKSTTTQPVTTTTECVEGSTTTIGTQKTCAPPTVVTTPPQTPPSGPLPVTGKDVTWLVVMALGAIWLGLVTLLASKFLPKQA